MALDSGTNILRMTTVRNAGWQSYGFTVNNVSLVQISDVFASIINGTVLNSLAILLTEIPGSRYIFSDIMAYFINFDTLQF
jgi:hypothetical protein